MKVNMIKNSCPVVHDKDSCPLYNQYFGSSGVIMMFLNFSFLSTIYFKFFSILKKFILKDVLFFSPINSEDVPLQIIILFNKIKRNK